MSDLVDRRRGVVSAAPPTSRLASVYSAFSARPQLTFSVAVVTSPLLGLLDWATGPDIAFSVFYLLPISVIAWMSTALRMTVLSVVAALTWITADIAAGAEFEHPAIPIWNTLTRLAVFLLVGRLIGQLRTSVEQERELARTDPLTGVSNSRWFYEQAAKQLRLSRSHLVALIYLDLDDFKAINDRRGHSGGDQVLAAVGEALRQATRDAHDVVARLGGDEFALLLVLPVTSDAEADVRAVAARVRELLSGHPIPVSFSAGAIGFASPPASVDAALEAVDQLMYEVKRAGKGALLYRDAGTRPSEVR